MKVAVIFDGVSAAECVGTTSPEQQIIETIEAVDAALSAEGHRVERVPVNPDGRWFERVRRGKYDLVFNLCEGVAGVADMEPAVIAALEMFFCPAPISDQKRRAIESVVLRAYRVLGCRDWSRIDVRLDAGGVPNVVEVNPLPGILPNPADNSCFPKAARAAGLSYDELIQSCLRHAADRQGIALPGHLARPYARRAVATA